MYDDPSFIRDNGIRIYLNDHEKAAVEQAARDSGRERASFIRDAALVVARFIRSRRTQKPQQDLMVQIQLHLASQPAANDDNTSMYCLAG